MESNLTRISVTIAGRKYTLSVERNDETLIRNAAETMNRRISDFARKYPGKDMQDILSMILISNAAELVKSENGNHYLGIQLQKRLDEISLLLAEAV